jgi:hypothetical protein
MTNAGIRMIFVTHLYQLSRYFRTHQSSTTLFLRAERESAGTGGSRSSRPSLYLRATVKTCTG